MPFRARASPLAFPTFSEPLSIPASITMGRGWQVWPGVQMAALHLWKRRLVLLPTVFLILPPTLRAGTPAPKHHGQRVQTSLCEYTSPTS